MKKSFLYLCLLILFTGCGYKPASYYAKQEISGLVYTDIKINIDSASNSVLLKDTMNEIVLSQLDSTLTDNKEAADTIVLLELGNVSHNALTSDDEGYARVYRTSVSLNVQYRKKGLAPKRFSVNDYYDYSLASTTSLSEQVKDTAVTKAVTKALQELLSKLAVSSFKE